MNGQLGEPSSLTRIIRSFRKYSRASRYVMAGTRGSLSLWGGRRDVPSPSETCPAAPSRTRDPLSRKLAVLSIT